MTLRAVLLVFCSAIITCTFAQTTLSKSKKVKKVSPLFTVNARPVTTDEFIYLYRKNHQNNPQDFTQDKIEEYLDLFINFKLKVEEAKRRGMDTTEAFIKEYNQYRDELRKPYLPEAKLTDSLTRLTYERMKEEVKASHILINVKPDASPEDTLKAFNKVMAIRKRIQAGEDFETVAAETSDDPSARMNKGSLGYFTAMQMVYPFETAAYMTPVGEVSMPVRTQFGYHLIKVSDRRPARGEVEVAHIMIRMGEARSEAEARDLIFDIHDQLRAGVNWDELCLQYSEDPASKENGGKLRPFGIGMMSNVPEFERIAFDLQKPGDISDPVQTTFGWHIIRLIAKTPLVSFNEISPTLKNKVSRDERTQISRQAFQMKLRKDFGFKENTTIKAGLFARADSTLQQGKWTSTMRSDEKDVLFSLQDQDFTVKDFVAYVRKNQKVNNQPPGKYLEELYNNFVESSILQLLEKSIIEEHPDFSFILKEYYEGILLFEIMEKEVWNKASEDSVGQRRYFESNRARYKAGERANAVLYSSGSQDIMRSLPGMISENKEKALQEFVRSNKIRVESGFYKKEEKAVLQKVPWSEGVNTVELGGNYYVIWIREILPSGNMSFEEARSAVISDYQTYLEKVWLDQLRKEYPVKVNEKAKKYVLEELQKK